MCSVSDKLKLCTCGEDVYDSAKHYWIFHRYVKGRNEMLVGSIMCPYFADPETDQQNLETILHALNEGNPFDVDLNPKNHDRLSLHFSCDESLAHLSYGFRYNGKVWKVIPYNVFDFMQKHEEGQEGEILNALLK